MAILRDSTLSLALNNVRKFEHGIRAWHEVELYCPSKGASGSVDEGWNSIANAYAHDVLLNNAQCSEAQLWKKEFL